jgi:uncharacterized RDD family membrane protein YckC
VIGTRPAGFWIRAVAFAIDLIVLFLVQASLRLLAVRFWGADMAPVGPFTLLFAALYSTVLHALTGQTIGKLMVGVRVVNIDGSDVAVGAALLRFVGYFASFATFTLGYVMAGLRRDKRALHDLLAGTRVERVARERGAASRRVVMAES